MCDDSGPPSRCLHFIFRCAGQRVLVDPAAQKARAKRAQGLRLDRNSKALLKFLHFLPTPPFIPQLQIFRFFLKCDEGGIKQKYVFCDFFKKTVF